MATETTPYDELNPDATINDAPDTLNVPQGDGVHDDEGNLLTDPNGANQQPKTPVDIAKQSSQTGQSFLDLYNQYAKKPEYDQTKAETIQRNKNLSILADIIKTVGEGVTTGNGGKPIQRQSVAPTLDANLQRLNDQYKAEASAYKNNQFKYMLQDEVDKRRSEILKAQAEARAQQNAVNMAKWQAEQTLKAKAQENQKNYQDKSLKLHEQSNAISANKKTGEDNKTETYIDENNVAHVLPKNSYQAWSKKVAEMATKTGKYPDGTEIDADVLKAIKLNPTNALSLVGSPYISVVNGQVVPKTSAPASPNPAPKKLTPITNPFAPGSSTSIIPAYKAVTGQPTR